MKYLFIYITLVFSSSSFGQASIKALASKLSVQEGENFRYEIRTNRKCEIKKPSFKGFDLVGGPMIGQSSSYSNYNGAASQNTTYSYAYTLRARKSGTYLIEGPEGLCGKEKIRGNKLKIEVVKSGNIQEMSSGKLDNFIELKSNKSEVFVGEPFILTTTFYSREQPSSIEGIQRGEAENLQRQEITMESNRVITIDGVYYKVDLSKELCYADRVGDVEIMPYSGVLIKGMDFFNVKKLRGISNKLNVKIIPLPKDKPEFFSGMVGNFELTYQISKTEVKVGEAIDLDITIKGVGNFDRLDDPKLNLPETFHSYDPESSVKTSITNKGIAGEVRYRYVIVPKIADTFEIQPFVFPYFNVKSKKYEVLATELLNILVNEGDEDYGNIVKQKVDNEIEKKTLSLLRSTEGDKRIAKENLFGSAAHIFGTITPLFFVLGFILFKRRRTKNTEKNSVKSLQKGASSSAIKALNKLEKSEFRTAREIRAILDTFLLTKLKLSPAENSKERVLSELEQRNVKNDVQAHLKSIWEKLDMAQYAPLSEGDVLATIESTKNLVKELGGII